MGEREKEEEGEEKRSETFSGKSCLRLMRAHTPPDGRTDRQIDPSVCLSKQLNTYTL